MINETTNNKADSEKLTAELKTAFPKLSDADIALQATDINGFYEVVKSKQGINKDEAEKTVKKLVADFAAAGATDKNKSASAPTADQPALKPKVA